MEGMIWVFREEVDGDKTIAWGMPHNDRFRLSMEIVVLCIFLCFPPDLMFISLAFTASFVNTPCVTNSWSKTNSVMAFRYICSKIGIVFFTCLWSHVSVSILNMTFDYLPVQPDFCLSKNHDGFSLDRWSHVCQWPAITLQQGAMHSL